MRGSFLCLLLFKLPICDQFPLKERSDGYRKVGDFCESRNFLILFFFFTRWNDCIPYLVKHFSAGIFDADQCFESLAPKHKHLFNLKKK